MALKAFLEICVYWTYVGFLLALLLSVSGILALGFAKPKDWKTITWFRRNR